MNQLLQTAIQYHSAGQLAQAEILYRQVLQSHPKHPDALHLLGLIAHQLGKHDVAIELIRYAIDANGSKATFHNNLGLCYQALGRLDDAVTCYQQALAIRADLAEAYNNLAYAFNTQGKTGDAITYSQKALVIRPNYAEAHNNLGIALFEQGIALFEQGIALFEQGIALFEPSRLDEAVACYQKALQIKANFTKASNNLGNALSEQGKLDEAIGCYQQVLAIEPDFVEAHNNLGNALFNQGKQQDAVACYRLAVTIKPDFAETHYNFGYALSLQGKLEDALASYQQALALEPDYAEAHWNESLCRLQIGDYERGWEKYEWRWKRAGWTTLFRHFSHPLWLGQESLASKQILLWDEQGYGDTMQFVRYAHLVAKFGTQVVLEVQPGLKRLMQYSFGKNIQVIARGEAVSPCDYHVPLMSMPLAFNTTLDTVPTFQRYLYADIQDMQKWAQRLKEFHGLRVGLVWAGGIRRGKQMIAIDARRSLHLAAFVTLGGIPNMHFFSLQKGPPAAQLSDLRQGGWRGPEIVDYTNELHDWADTAALVANLDLVISCDTSTAHLSAAMGKPTWILNRYDTCWRWLLKREDSPWYPSVRLFRQQKPGDWSSVLAAVRSELDRFATAR